MLQPNDPISPSIVTSRRTPLRRRALLLESQPIPVHSNTKAMSTTYSESNTTSADGHSLFVRRWAPVATPPRADVLVLHGYAEHSGRYRELAHSLVPSGIAVTAVDLRGHGRSDGQRGYVRKFEYYHDDARSALGTLGRDAPVIVLGHSLGGLLALDWIISDHPLIAGLVLSSPFLELTNKASSLSRMATRLVAKLTPSMAVKSPLVGLGLSRDKDIVANYTRDPMVFSTINVRWLSEVMHAQDRVRAYRSLPCPLMFIYGSADQVAAPRASSMLAQQINAPRKDILCREGAYHEVLNELDRTHLHSEIGDWINQIIGQDQSDGVREVRQGT
jgi:acylglycerol lipase